MAHHIDRIALWSLTSLSAFLLAFVLTDGSILLSMLISFAAVFFLRILIRRYLPEKRWISRKQRIQRIERLFNKWALMDECLFASEISKYFPDYAEAIRQNECLFIQRLPRENAFSANELLDLRRSRLHTVPPTHRIYLFMTCPLAASARSLLPSLSLPHIEVIDTNDMLRTLLKSFDRLPEEDAQTIKTEQRRSFRDRAALFFQNLRPIRIGMYMCFFASMYLLTGAVVYLASLILYTVLLAIRLLYRKFMY